MCSIHTRDSAYASRSFILIVLIGFHISNLLTPIYVLNFQQYHIRINLKSILIPNQNWFHPRIQHSPSSWVIDVNYVEFGCQVLIICSRYSLGQYDSNLMTWRSMHEHLITAHALFYTNAQDILQCKWLLYCCITNSWYN